jgi:hypothetical protein
MNPVSDRFEQRLFLGCSSPFVERDLDHDQVACMLYPQVGFGKDEVGWLVLGDYLEAIILRYADRKQRVVDGVSNRLTIFIGFPAHLVDSSEWHCLLQFRVDGDTLPYDDAVGARVTAEPSEILPHEKQARHRLYRAN